MIVERRKLLGELEILAFLFQSGQSMWESLLPPTLESLCQSEWAILGEMDSLQDSSKRQLS